MICLENGRYVKAIFVTGFYSGHKKSPVMCYTTGDPEGILYSVFTEKLSYFLF